MISTAVVVVSRVGCLGVSGVKKSLCLTVSANGEEYDQTAQPILSDSPSYHLFIPSLPETNNFSINYFVMCKIYNDEDGRYIIHWLSPCAGDTSLAKARELYSRPVQVKFRFLAAKIFLGLKIQSTLVISKSKGPSEILRDIRTSTYQMCKTEENTNRTTKFHK